MELQQLRYVVAVAEEKSFTRAAQRCFVVQSALSHQIKAVEQEIGIALFARSSRRVELTTAGAVFVEYARESLAAAERAYLGALAAEGQVQGRLRIGVIPTVTAVDIPGVLAQFHRDYPQVKIELRSGGSEQFIEDIHAHHLDIAFLGLAENAQPSRVDFRELSRESLVAVVSPDHPLREEKKISLADIASERFVDFPMNSAGRAQTDMAFERAGLVREVAFEVTAIDLMLALIRAGLAVGLLSKQCVPADDSLATIAVEDGPARVEYLAWSDFNTSPAAKAFLKALIPNF
ncbi:LysR family transcriptional regulator [Corynebacterium sp. sy017]|nr:LysR family transcriptional regulator [Corynebacterium sp. sy017]QDZ43562.1 LysR family transcriptional regulator [Corynebacterium sp. sy039]TSD92353.1 LysR family transcriptional regulator [Corynebacterium sp. SY003]